MAVQAQNHIHLDTDLDGAPENSPTNIYTALVPETPAYNPHIALEWAVDGTLMKHAVTSGGSPVVSEGRRYRLKVTRAQLTALIADLGKECSFVPHYHPDDNSDHTAYIETVQFVSLADVQSREHADLATYYCTIELQKS